MGVFKCFLIAINTVASETMVIDPLPPDWHLKVKSCGFIPLNPHVVVIML